MIVVALAALATAGALADDDIVLYASAPGGPDLFGWDAVSGADAYDVVRDGLSPLHGPGGGLGAATLECLGDDLVETGFGYEPDPPPGEGFWFLVRPVAGGHDRGYDSGGPGQAGSRDGVVAASGADCPSRRFRFDGPGGSNPPGYACFSQTYPCEVPETVELWADGAIVHAWAPEPLGRERWSVPPGSLCFPADEAGSHV